MGHEATAGQAPTRVRYRVLAWLCALAALAYVHRSCLAVAAGTVQRELGMSGEEMAWALAAFAWGYAAFQLPSGALGDRWGARIGLTACVLVWSAATGMMALAGGFLVLFACRLLLGVGQAGIFPCSVNTIARWFPASEKSMPSGLLAAFMSVGAAVATALTGVLLEYLYWEALFVLFALPGLVAAAWFYGWFRDSPALHPSVNEAEARFIQEGRPPAPPRAAGPVPWGRILTSVNMGLVCGQQFFRAFGYFFFLTWFPTYLEKVFRVRTQESGYLTSFPLLGVVLGSSAGGFLMDWVWRRTGSKRLSRQAVGFLGVLASGAFFVAAYFCDDVTWAVAAVSVSSFWAGLAGPTGYTVTIDLGGRHVATVFSTMNMAGNVGAALSAVVVERFASAWGSWQAVPLLLAGIYAGAAVCWTLVDPHRPIVPAADDSP